MQKGEHTPGPWHIGEGNLGARIVYDERGWAIADAKIFHGNQGAGQDYANARLIAAAPELLEALTEILGPLNVCSDNPHVSDDALLPVDMTMGELRKARAAIARAKGLPS